VNDGDRITLVRSLARLVVAENRADAIGELATCLGVEAVCFFTNDPEVGALLAAPGFAQTLPDGRSWNSFLVQCVQQGRHTAELPYPKAGAFKSVTGVAWEKNAVLALVGPTPPSAVMAELRLHLPLLAVAFRDQQLLAVHVSRAQLAEQLVRESAALTKGLDTARRAAQQEIIARKAADKALKLATDELTTANAELTRARDQAVAASMAKDDFLAALSHELRTPLNPVLLLASEAAGNEELPLEVRQDFAIIAKNAQLEARLIDDLLDLTRITRGKMTLDKQRLELRPILDDAVANVRAELNAKNIELATTFDEGERKVLGDPARLQQIFWNVLKNAVKFTPAGGNIRVETQFDAASGEVIIRFTDTGIGMTEPEVTRVFELFVQGDHASGAGSHRFGGLGLGLAISRMLIALHGGTIEASSAGRGKGSTFTVRLPEAEDTSREEPPTAASTRLSKGDTRNVPACTRVLLVEDHAATSAALTRVLTRRNYHVVNAASIADAMRAADREPFDLVISDIGLPDGDGYSLMSELDARHGLTGIAVTGYGMNADIARSEAAGFVTHVTKPVSVRSLEAALELAARARAVKLALP
jgi:signal transduction histidine kinase/ActR/RegA family two-component response regulator